MKILHITDAFLPGGISTYLNNLTRQKKYDDVKMFIAATPGRFAERLSDNIPFIPISTMKYDSLEKNLFGFPESILILSRFIQKENIDIIHSHKRYSHVLAKVLSKRFSIPHVTGYHNELKGKKIFTIFGESTICCTEAVRTMVVNSFGCSPFNVKTINLGIPPFEDQSYSQKQSTFRILNIPSKKTVISSVGQFVPAKDKESLILSINILRSQIDISNLIFILLGHGPQKEHLQSIVNRLNLTENIHFVDGMFDVESLFNISEFMILNSITEGFGIVLLEAASLKKIHIGTNVGGISEFIENHNTGLLISPKDPEVLANAIRYLLEHPDERQRMGKNAKNKYESKYSYDRMIDETINVYRQQVRK